jgi:outer membrane lipoprotein-sorting protein
MVVLALPAAEPNEAEKLFREMDKKVTSAKSLECTFEAKVEGGKEAGTIKGSLMLTEGNKSRLEMSFEHSGKTDKETMVSDGTKMGPLSDKTPKGRQDAPKWLNDAYRGALGRSGLTVPLMFITRVGEQPKEFKADDEFKVSDFKLGKKEKVGDQEAQAIQYKLAIKEFPEPLTATVWIDTKTNLPLKREITAKKGDEKLTVTETYSALKIDPKIDPKKFEFPKE